MELETYFEFLAPDDIRIKGTRIGVESILYEYIHRGQTPDAIAGRFHTVSLEQVYAAILYYLRNRERLDAYLAEWLAFGQSAREAQELNPPAAVLRLRQRKAEQQPVE
jgi:uncharacterized protein (DUF433 family)